MEDTEPVATLMDSTTSKIQQLQKAFAELESHRAVTLNLKWKELEEHFHGLERSLKRRFHELEDQEKQYETKNRRAREILEKQEAAVVAKEQASLEKLQEKQDAAVFAIVNALQKHRKVSTAEPSAVPYDGQCESPTIDDQPPDAMTAESNLGEIIDPFENGNLEYPTEEIPHALKSAVNPAQLVLNSLEDFYPKEVSNVDGKKDSTLLGLRRTCIMLMECLSILLMYTDLVSVSDLVSEDVKGQAKTIAEEWKPKLDSLDVDANNGNSLEAHAFLQLLATFGIASDFDEEELSRLIPMVSRRRQAAELCRFLGLSERMPGVIEVLVNSGRQIDALLRPGKPGSASPTNVQNDVNERELTALKAVIKCVEEHKLEEQYPVDPLQKRLLQLEKAKADKKRANEVAKPQPKRPRASGVGCGPRVTNSAPEKAFYPRVPDRYPQYVYDRQYIYPGPADNHVPPLMSSATYNFSPSHGNYFGNCYQYQTSYLH
ncbi:FRIGIDA-LIKE PROTEIN 3-RELATED [Salix koriyanagi]|uniref:FRIGIDA-like protein n=1 Tax=Salix koriyanagi TaxID=2511006 RepID=A0A9Q0TFW0_9ROSI|nr:FRIGIDA-LIKE PROTEIN 3-RELATED [Salix koriyanagi]KAJ6710899.1 FRIGIDA-LIKE PROTEIN 3-RELATED [Salix koriyanagi]